jgi:release factor glutamine methyltransferase
VCNPPYISDKRLEGERALLLDLEPREAFAAGPYGLGIHMRVVRDALAFLRPGGALLFEVGLGQDRQVKILFQRAREYERIEVARNAAGEGRVVLGYRKRA